MNLLFVLIGVFIGFIVGFIVCDSLNHSKSETIKTLNSTIRKYQSSFSLLKLSYELLNKEYEQAQLALLNTDKKVSDRTKQLVRLSISSSSESEARTAAVQACKLLSKELEL